VFSVVNGDKASAKTAYDSLKARVVSTAARPTTCRSCPA
jgi:hypothetical protein